MPNADYQNFLQYSKFVQLKLDEAEEIVKLICSLLNVKSCSDVQEFNIFEAGTGYGCISIPVMRALEKTKIKFKWYGIEKDDNKIKAFPELYYKYNEDKIIDYRNGTTNEYERVHKDIFQSLSNRMKVLVKLPEHIKISKFDIEEINEYKNLTNLFTQTEIISVLFIPFIFQHIYKWREFMKYILETFKFSKEFIIVSGELEGDWEAFFSPWKATNANKWRNIFMKIWENSSNITTALRDYRYKNLDVFKDFLENQGFKMESIDVHLVEIKVKTSIDAIIEQFKFGTWSVVNENSDQKFKVGLIKLFTENEKKEKMDFRSFHRFDFIRVSRYES